MPYKQVKITDLLECRGDESELDESITGHRLHCLNCDFHLTSLLLCPECGIRYEIVPPFTCPACSSPNAMISADGSMGIYHNCPFSWVDGYPCTCLKDYSQAMGEPEHHSSCPMHKWWENRQGFDLLSEAVRPQPDLSKPQCYGGPTKC
jgi:hypothetical protein